MSCGSSFRFVGALDAFFVGCQAEVSSRHNLNNLDLPPFCQCKKGFLCQVWNVEHIDHYGAATGL